MSGFTQHIDSPFPDENILFNSASGLTGQQLQKNQLAIQGQQMDLTAADHEQVARLSAGLLNEPDVAKRADLYSRGVGMLQSQGLAKYAPPTLPDESTLRMLAAQGVSSEKLYEYGAGRTAAQGALGALNIGSTGTGTPAGGGGDFATKLTTAESGGNPSVINKQGYTGQFQFGKQRLSELGYYTPAPGEDMNDNTKWAGKVSVPGFNVTDQASFAANPAAQQAVFNTHLGDIDKAIDQMPNAGKFDRNGLRAVAHLGGISGMERFASSGGVYDPADANGTRLSSYYQRFSGGGTQTAAAPTGGGGTPGSYQVASTAPTAPPGSTAAPDAQWDLPGAPAPDQPPAPATAPPATTTAPAAPQVPLAPMLQLRPSGLTAEQEALFRDQANRPQSPVQAQALAARVEAQIAQNRTYNSQAEQHNFDRQHQAQADAQAQQEKALADARAAEQLRLSQVTSQREQDAAAALAEQRRVENERAAETQRLAQITSQRSQEAAQRDTERLKLAQAEAAVKARQAAQPYQGMDLGAQDTNVLMSADPKSKEYAIAYQRMAAPHYNQDGSVVYPNLSAFQKPGYVPPGASEPPDYGAAKVTPPTILTQDQARAGTYADRMVESNAIMSTLDSAALDYVQKGLSKIGGTVGFGMNSSDYQRVKQAQENFVNSALRLESGAVISEDEFKKASQQYFPQPGDSAAVIAQKKANREAEITGFVREAGPGYKPKPPAAPAPTRVIRYDHNGKRIEE